MTTNLRAALPLSAAFCLALALCACRAQEPEPSPANTGESEPAAAQPTAADGTRREPATGTDARDPGKKDDGYEIVRAKTKEGGETSLALKPPEGWKIVTPPSTPDPHAGGFSLAQATKGLTGRGKLVATIATSVGELQCELFADTAPITVASFVGLARGTRKTWDAAQRAWVGRPHYDGTTFHRVIPGFMIQGGDSAGDGSGRMWFSIPDEVHPSRKHERGGLLCMANRGPNTNEAQFFITEAAAPHLDGSYTIFGECRPTEVVYRIARVPQSGPPNNRPLQAVRIDRVTVARLAGGLAAQASVTSDATGTAPLPLPRNEVPGVVPPGTVVRGDRSPP